MEDPPGGRGLIAPGRVKYLTEPRATTNIFPIVKLNVCNMSMGCQLHFEKACNKYLSSIAHYVQRYTNIFMAYNAMYVY